MRQKCGKHKILNRMCTHLVLVALFNSMSTTDSITFPCISPLLGPTIPSAPSREPSPARSRTPDDDPFEFRLTIRGGDLQVMSTLVSFSLFESRNIVG